MKCQCGCGMEILVKSKYYTPKFILGHNGRKYKDATFFCDTCKKKVNRYGSKTILSNTHFCSKECKLTYFSEIAPIHHIGQWKKGNVPWNIGLRGIKTGGRPTIDTYDTNTQDRMRKELRNAAIKSRISQSVNDSSIERKLENYLLFNDILYVKQYPYELGIADFWLPESNLIVECDGTYWHSRPKTIEKNIKQTTWLEDNGFLVIRLKEDDITKNFGICAEMLSNAI